MERSWVVGREVRQNFEIIAAAVVLSCVVAIIKNGVIVEAYFLCKCRKRKTKDKMVLFPG